MMTLSLTTGITAYISGHLQQYTGRISLILTGQIQKCHDCLCLLAKLCYNIENRGVVVPERNRAPFWQMFLSRNSAPVNIVYHSLNADTAAFRQISSYY